LKNKNVIINKNMSVCDNQQTFNEAFYKALKNSRKKEEKIMSSAMCTYVITHTIFLIWGIILAFKSQPPETRVLHIATAIVFAPAYVLAYYLNMLK
jgi:hypothetical protein